MSDTRAPLVLKNALLSMGLNVLMVFVKAFAGVLGNSFALISDAIESLNDVIASFFLVLGLKFSHKPPDECHPYGHGRFELLATFFNLSFMGVSSLFIAYHSIVNLFSDRLPAKPFTLFVLLFVILFKEFFSRRLSRVSEDTHSGALKAEAWHHRSDSLTSLSAFIGISLSCFLGPKFVHADDVAALFCSFVILYNSYRIFRHSLSEMMDEQTHSDLIIEIRRISESLPDVLGTEKCYVRKLGMFFYVDLHILVLGSLSVSDGHQIAHRVKDELITKIPHIHDVLIHVEPL